MTLPPLTIAPVAPHDAFLGASEQLLAGIQPLAEAVPATAWSLTFLAGQVLECALKAFLAKNGVSERELRQLGHALGELWERAVAKGFACATGTPVWLQRLSELHDGPYVIRYPMGLNGVVLPQVAQMAAELPQIVIAIRTAIRSS